jgi:hypothetical protein
MKQYSCYTDHPYAFICLAVYLLTKITLTYSSKTLSFLLILFTGRQTQNQLMEVYFFEFLCESGKWKIHWKCCNNNNKKELFSFVSASCVTLSALKIKKNYFPIPVNSFFSVTDILTNVFGVYFICLPACTRVTLL